MLKGLMLLAIAASGLAIGRRAGIETSSCISGKPSTALGMWCAFPFAAALLFLVLG
ncbi:hypothetical protein J4G43_030130 [Bradyrhizobium barranii subsp. barranii]|uniref:Uncharacterized protein n=1 Tax=Bradyrhizobium barranii subsp. barranii TaxID=2823807 RepID=A0A939S6E7_9BRAD|nr:hypothetical protein [Bradyrhizobium barranii]UEM08998.1 hypothetical protein J4G43_030130 [Bradyrhizobium barranii subsp. barranii]